MKARGVSASPHTPGSTLGGAASTAYRRRMRAHYETADSTGRTCDEHSG
jgi:hypothetical protein